MHLRPCHLPYVGSVGKLNFPLTMGPNFWMQFAWILSSRKVEDILSPEMNISGQGIVDGIPTIMSSTRAELTGLTALSIIFRLLIDFHTSNANLTMACDNQGALTKIQTFSTWKLRHHHEPNLAVLNSMTGYRIKTFQNCMGMRTCWQKKNGKQLVTYKTKACPQRRYTTSGWTV